MNIDQRLEALAQTVELIAGMQLKSEERQRKNDEQIGSLTERMKQVMEAINSLARIAEAHEHRLDHLEGQ